MQKKLLASRTSSFLLEEQKFHSRQQQERLTLETEIAKAQAKENVLASLTESTPRSIVPNPVMLPVSRPRIGEFPDSKKLEIIPGVQTFPDSVKLEPKPGVDQVPLAAAEPGAMRDREIASLPDAKVTSTLNWRRQHGINHLYPELFRIQIL